MISSGSADRAFWEFSGSRLHFSSSFSINCKDLKIRLEILHLRRHVDQNAAFNSSLFFSGYYLYADDVHYEHLDVLFTFSIAMVIVEAKPKA